MIKILGNRVLVSKVEEEAKEGFQTVEVQDSFVYKGKIEQTGGEVRGEMVNRIPGLHEIIPKFNNGDIVLFAKYSPDTQEVDVDGVKMKIIKVDDILAVYESN